MNRTSLITLLVVAGVALAAGGYYAGRHAPGSDAQPTAAAASVPGDKRVLYWHDPMVPGQRFDKPGKSPFMDMQLVPVYADSDAGDGGVKVSPGLFFLRRLVRLYPVRRQDRPLLGTLPGRRVPEPISLHTTSSILCKSMI